jgi:hypothetical protein
MADSGRARSLTAAIGTIHATNAENMNRESAGAKRT